MLRHNICHSFYKAMSKSKKRNHNNIQSLSPLSQINSSKTPSPCKNVINNRNLLRDREVLFGELVEEESPPFYKAEFDTSPCYKSRCTPTTANSDCFDTDSITSGISDIKLNKSLSSSPSWSDNDFDSSKKVQDELELMDRVLRGIEPIPLHYDMDEYKQWMETFPNISLFGKTERGPYTMWKNELEICSSARSNSRDNQNLFVTYKRPMTEFRQYKEEINKAVIHNIYENLTIRLNEKSPLTAKRSVLKSDSMGDFNSTQTYLSNCLNNSPFDSIKKKYEKRSFISRENSREEKLKNSPTFESLPLMFEDPKKRSPNAFDRYKNNSLNGIKIMKSRRTILLPPIENNKLNTTQFRSTSAMPIYSSMLSAKSIKLESKIGSGGKSRKKSQL